MTNEAPLDGAVLLRGHMGERLVCRNQSARSLGPVCLPEVEGPQRGALCSRDAVQTSESNPANQIAPRTHASGRGPVLWMRLGRPVGLR